MRIGVHQEHEFDVAAGDEGVDVVVLEGVDFFEVSVVEGDVSFSAGWGWGDGYVGEKDGWKWLWWSDCVN